VELLVGHGGEGEVDGEAGAALGRLLEEAAKDARAELDADEVDREEGGGEVFILAAWSSSLG
jgi:hypothetical protein